MASYIYPLHEELKVGDKVQGRHNSHVFGEVLHRCDDMVWVKFHHAGSPLSIQHAVQRTTDWVKVKPKVKTWINVWLTETGSLYAQASKSAAAAVKSRDTVPTQWRYIETIEKEYEV